MRQKSGWVVLALWLLLSGAFVLNVPSDFRLECTQRADEAGCTLATTAMMGSDSAPIVASGIVDAREGVVPGQRGTVFLLVDRAGVPRAWLRELNSFVPRDEWVRRFREWFRSAEPTLSLRVDARAHATANGLMLVVGVPLVIVAAGSARKKSRRAS